MLRRFGLPLAAALALAATAPASALASFGTLSYTVRGPVGTYPNTEHSFTAGCPAGTHVLGGGQYILAADRDVIVHSSAPMDKSDNDPIPDDGWRSVIDGFNGAHYTATEFAICSTKQPTYVSKAVTLNGPAQPKLRTSCPAGEGVAGGGVDIRAQYNSAYITTSTPGPGDSWEGHAVAGLRMPHQKVTDWAICAPAKLTYQSAYGEVADNSFGEASASCPAGTRVVGGGVRTPDFPFSQSDVDMRPTISSPVDGPDSDFVPDDGWQVEADDWGAAGSLMVESTAICLS
jgi:hypothetical protein